jgi:multidrug transporter EmrE-like cation transporter
MFSWSPSFSIPDKNERNQMSRTGIVLIMAIVFNALANILIKVGMLKAGRLESIPDAVKYALGQPFLYAGVVSFGLALVAYSIVLSKLNLSVAYPIMVSMGLIIVVLVSYFALKETITFLQIAGFIFIIAGVWMVAR